LSISPPLGGLGGNKRADKLYIGQKINIFDL
jgi:hypothetical protein